MALIAISGKIGSGKDTVTSIIQYLVCLDKGNLSEHHKNFNDFNKTPIINGLESGWKNKKFAGKLKTIVSILTGIPVEDLEKEEVKNSYLGEEWDKYHEGGGIYSDKANFIKGVTERGHLERHPIEVWLENNRVRMTVRQLLQEMGTDAMRNVIHPNIHVNALFADYKAVGKANTSNSFNDDSLKHGFNKTKLYRTYHNMMQRCNNSKHPQYDNYGGRGIEVCEEWKRDFVNFSHWALANGYSDDLTLDREEVNDGYNPDNCRFVSYSTQAINTRNRKDNTSGYRGVSLDKGKWRAVININKKQKFLGYFDTAEEAAAVYEEAFMERENLYASVEEANLVYPNWILSDMRFPNELEAVKKRSGITIRVERPTMIEPSTHLSETALDDAKFDHYIDNRWTLEILIDNVRAILEAEGIL